MDANDDSASFADTIDEAEERVTIALDSPAGGVHPAAALVIALWYSFTASSAMSKGFHFIYEHGQNDYYLAQNLMWIAGIGIGVGLAVYLSRSSRLAVGVIASVIMSGLLLLLLIWVPSDDASNVSLFGFIPSATQFVTAIAVLTLASGLIGTAVGVSARTDEPLDRILLGIRHRHWFWLWLAFYAWVVIVPTGIYYVWLELISTGYVLIHPSLWFSDAWTEGWTVSFGIAGFAALLYGVNTSIKGVSAKCSANMRTRKRVFKFLLGTLIMAGPVANILFLIAISSLKHLPDGITSNPWWILH